MNSINFFAEDTSFRPVHVHSLTNWLLHIAREHQHRIDEINYIFCSDAYLLAINQQYLRHDDYTDIITFDHSPGSGLLLSDIFISVDRVMENAREVGTGFEQELHRVMAHGLLHLLGYTDKTEEDKSIMRQKEDACLSLLKL